MDVIPDQCGPVWAEHWSYVLVVKRLYENKKYFL